MNQRYIVVGDIHGDLNQLVYPILYWKQHCDRKLIFLGDYFDRGHSNVYIYEIIKGLLQYNHPNIILIRGNHECMSFCTRDVYNNYNSYISSYLHRHIIDLPLLMYYYDNNILFTHTPTSVPLDNLNRDITFESTYEHTNMNYKNIHGHDHELSSKQTIKQFIKGSRKMISLDVDASYSFNRRNNRGVVESIVYYIDFNCCGELDIIRDRIMFGSSKDMNSKTFSDILTMLDIPDINLVESFNIFNDIFKHSGCSCISEFIINNYNVIKQCKSAYNIYYDDIPIEFYEYYKYEQDTSLLIHPNKSAMALFCQVVFKDMFEMCDIYDVFKLCCM